MESLKHSQGIGPTQPIAFPPVSISGAPRPEGSSSESVRSAVTVLVLLVIYVVPDSGQPIGVLVSCPDPAVQHDDLLADTGPVGIPQRERCQVDRAWVDGDEGTALMLVSTAQT